MIELLLLSAVGVQDQESQKVEQLMKKMVQKEYTNLYYILFHI